MKGPGCGLIGITVKVSICLEHRYGSHRKPSEKLDVLKGTTYENWKHCWAITATTQGQSLAGSRPVLERFGKAEGDEMTVQVLGFNISMKNNSHQISRVKTGLDDWTVEVVPGPNVRFRV